MEKCSDPLFLFALLPLALASNLSRYHLLVLAAVLMAAGWLDTLRRSRARALTWPLAAALLVSMAIASRQAQTQYRPCTPENLASDRDLIGWELMAPDLGHWLDQKARACAADGRAPALVESIDHVLWRTSPSTTVALVNRHASVLVADVTSAVATSRTPVTLHFAVNGRLAAVVTLTTPRAERVVVPLSSNLWTILRGMQRVDVSASAPFTCQLARSSQTPAASARPSPAAPRAGRAFRQARS